MIVEARRPDGRVVELTEVNLTQSGLLIIITDTDGNQAYIHRFAWEGVIQAVTDLFLEEKRRTREEEHELR